VGQAGLMKMADDLSHVLWLGGMSGVGKTTAARALRATTTCGSTRSIPTPMSTRRSFLQRGAHSMSFGSIRRPRHSRTGSKDTLVNGLP
jgi:hypothetical protein